MRQISLMSTLVLVISSPAAAQGWIEFQSPEDFFSVNFPGQPTVRETTYTTEYRLTLPARVFTVQAGPNRYSVTVVDYTNAERMHAERAAKCKAEGGDGDICNNPGRGDVRGAIVTRHSGFCSATPR